MTFLLRRLAPGDEAAIEALLALTPETTIFLRSNLARAGLADDGAPFSGTWVGAFEDERLVGVAAHFWNDNIVIAPGPHAEVAAAHAVAIGARRVAGLLGPHEEVVRVRRALGLGEAAVRSSSKEILYQLPLDALNLPAAVTERRVLVRPPQDDELSALLDWRMQYCEETSRIPDTPETRAAQRQYLEGYQAKGHHFVVTAAGERVAYSALNATVADIVQIGGVWTPPALRGRGHARCAVAGSLRIARARGARLAVLFTDEKNASAQRAYVAIGFRPVGDYAIVFFADADADL